ncbi:hypothetical protein ACA910_013202 [Epithemia clementina (nom. ined.)]
MSNDAVAFPITQELELWFYQSANPSTNGQEQQQWDASQRRLQDWVNRAQQSEQYRAPLASTCFQLFADDHRAIEVRFASLTTLSRLKLNEYERQQLRNYLLFQFGASAVKQQSSQQNAQQQQRRRPPPAFLRNKAAMILMQHVLLDVPDRWSNLLQDMSTLAQTFPELFLKTMETLLEDFLLNDTDKQSIRRVKDLLKGYVESDESTDLLQQRSSTPLEELFGTTVHLLSMSLSSSSSSSSNNNENDQNDTNLQVLAVNTIKAFFMWTELSFLGTGNANRALELLLVALQPNRTEATVQVAALSAWGEWTTSASLHKPNDKESSISTVNDPKLPVMMAVLERLHEYNILPYSGESEFEIEVVIEVAKLITLFGFEVEPLRTQSSSMAAAKSTSASTSGSDSHLSFISLFNKVLDMFFRGLAYDDIDVSGAVLPLAARLAQSMRDESPETNGMGIRQHIPQTLNILYRQLKYPLEFPYDFDDEDNAEEEQYRSELCKLFVKLVMAVPDVCLQFVCEAAGQFLNNSTTLGMAPTPDVEATLRLLFHYAEGIRPAPGVKAVLRNPTFCSLLTAVHDSDIASHSHPEVLCLYFDTSVRYCLFFKQQSASGDDNSGSKTELVLLGKLLESISGSRGLQHSNAKVRSRCCYLFLRLVKELISLLRPLVETAVHGISNLLSNNELELRPDDTLYLFEALGFLLGKTGLSSLDQQRYLTMVMTPHVRSIKVVLSGTTSRTLSYDEVEIYGQSLSYSVAAIAYLSKGFSKQPSEEIQQVLVEATSIAQDVLRALPMSDAVRSKVMVFLQRMIQSIDSKILHFVPEFLRILIEHCNTDDILFVAQLFNQLCIKFKDEACTSIDAALMPFLRKCQALANSLYADAGTTAANSNSSTNAHIYYAESSSSDLVKTPPHAVTEQLSIQKLAFTVLHHIVLHKATAVLTSSTNASSLEAIFNTVKDGAMVVQDPIIKKTCLKFFRDLLEQWTSDADSNGFQSGLKIFVCQTLIPGVWQSMVMPAFDERDAQQSRNVNEFAHILFLIQEKHGWETVHNALRSTGSCWPSNANTYWDGADSSVKGPETCLMNILGSCKSKT